MLTWFLSNAFLGIYVSVCVSVCVREQSQTVKLSSNVLFCIKYTMCVFLCQ